MTTMISSRAHVSTQMKTPYPPVATSTNCIYISTQTNSHSNKQITGKFNLHWY